MARRARKKSQLERRIRGLEKEAGKVRGDIRTLSRALSKGNGLAGRSRPHAHRQGYLDLRTERASPSSVPEQAPSANGIRAQKSGAPGRGAIGYPAFPRGGGQPGKRGGRNADVDNQRFAAYLASGSFGGMQPLGHEKNVQRNKAIFMIVVVLVVAFVIVRLLF